MVEGARLESVYTSKGYRGFESLSLRGNVNPIESMRMRFGVLNEHSMVRVYRIIPVHFIVAVLPMNAIV